jgi:hypothetical protein
MKIDRELQRRIIESAVRRYPAKFSPFDIAREQPDEDALHLMQQISYLDEHGLIETVKSQAIGVPYAQVVSIKATHRGIDFIADDGGLSAILGVVTIKLHEDSIKAMLIQKIEGSDAEPTVKSDLVKQVKALPAEGLQTLTTTALQAGLNALPNAVQLLHGWLTNR